MSEIFLKEILSSRISLPLLLHWLENTDTKNCNFEEITKWNCDRVDFISFFLNYIHDVPLDCETSNDVQVQTPKTPTSSVLVESNSRNASPISKPKKFTSPKTPTSICLGDYLKPKSVKKKAQRNLNKNDFANNVRRINPTNVVHERSPNFKNNKNSFSFHAIEESKDSVDQRSYLAEERLKVISSSHNKDMPTAPVFKNVKQVVAVNADLVTHQEELKVLACIYSCLLDNCLVSNISREIHFIITLLLCKSSSGVVTASMPLLDSVHNQVYFAACTLSMQWHFLKVLDKCTVRLLLENSRFQQFADHTVLVAIKTLLENKNDVCTSVIDPQSSVYFKYDTDNRDNFPSEPSFRNFCKQRDMFYNILKIWNNQHLTHNWNFESVLGHKVRTLVNLYWDPCNYIHFARLFKSQMITSLCQNISNDNAHSSAISSISNVDAEKLSRLNSRMVRKQNSNDFNVGVTFIGHEEFFRDFIVSANSYMFNKHLIDIMISEIANLNEFSVNIEEFSIDDGSIKKTYLTHLKSLRVLAKYLGFIEARPYNSEGKRLPPNIFDSQLQMRNLVHPSLNFKEIVLNALKKKMLTLTVPWVTVYLGMFDSISLKLKHFNEVIVLLFQIYYSIRCSPMIVKLTLGWLFELPHFPTHLYYIWVSQYVQAQLPEADLLEFYLDDLNIFDHNVSHICCPYLDEFKNILQADANQTRGVVTFKHITPISSDQSSSNASSTITQMRLEEAFFRSQPESLKKIVDFVSEQVASGCIKEIFYDMLPHQKQLSLEQFQDSMQAGGDIQELTRRFASMSLESLRYTVNVSTKASAETRVTAAMNALLPMVAFEEAKKLSIDIAIRICVERIQDWICNHIQEDLFINYFETEVKKSKLNHPKKSKRLDKFYSRDRSQTHNEDASTGVELLKKLTELSIMLVEESDVFKSEDLIQAIKSIQQSINERRDINGATVVRLGKMTLDCLILISSHKPDMMSESLLNKACELFNESHNLDDIFNHILSPRNEYFLSRSQDYLQSYKSFNMLITVLIQKNFLPAASLKKQESELDHSLVHLPKVLKLRLSDD